MDVWSFIDFQEKSIEDEPYKCLLVCLSHGFPFPDFPFLYYAFCDFSKTPHALPPRMVQTAASISLIPLGNMAWVQWIPLSVRMVSISFAPT